MSFSGRVSRESHEGGLLISFEGRAPGLYTGIRIVGGRFLGRVDSVIGPINNPYIHVKPVSDDLMIEKTIGSPVEIAPRDRRPKSERGKNRKNNPRNNRRKTDSKEFPNMKPGDWVCPKCKNHNYASKNFCNRSNCDVRKPGNSGEGKGRRNTPARTRRPDRKGAMNTGKSNRRNTNRQSKSRNGNIRKNNNSRNNRKSNSRR